MIIMIIILVDHSENKEKKVIRFLKYLELAREHKSDLFAHMVCFI